jgi:regulator of protease activity HflC (stomatin/prohibitin superfamily)
MSAFLVPLIMDASTLPPTRFKDAPLSSINGFVGLGIHAGLSIALLLSQALWASAWPLALLLNIGGGLLWFLLWNSYVIVNPNEAVVAQFFGKYVGTLKEEGFRFFPNPLYGTSRISLRINNFESSKLKVNDVNANPINIAAVVVWRVYDAAEAIFEVEKYQHYVQIQSEAALREMATKYPYDAIEEKDIGGITLSGHQDIIAEELQASVEARLSRAGIAVLEARISYLAYSTEIAQAMLRRQQASAVVAARREIVDGAVGMVELALEQLSEKQIIDLDEDKKATMVSNLLVVLCSETDTTPVVNTGTLYQ